MKDITWKIEPGAIVDANGKLVCIPIQGSNASIDPKNNYDVPEFDANRLLISCGPELLSAARYALRLIKDTWTEDHGVPQVGTAWGMLEKAIAKAEGKAQ